MDDALIKRAVDDAEQAVRDVVAKRGLSPLEGAAFFEAMIERMTANRDTAEQVADELSSS